MTSLVDESNSAKPDSKDEEYNGINNTYENAVKATYVGNHADARQETSYDLFQDVSENDRCEVSDDISIDENDLLSTNISTKCSENDVEMKEDVYVSSQTDRNKLHDPENYNSEENTFESELSTQLQAEQAAGSPNDSCTDYFNSSTTTADEDVQTSHENIESGEKISPAERSDGCTSIQTETNSIVENDFEKQKSDDKICTENESDCPSDVEKTSIYLSLSDESDDEPLKWKKTPNSPCRTPNLISPSKIKRSPSSWSPRIQNVTSCSQNANNNSPFPSNVFIKEEILIDEMDDDNHSYHLRRKTPSSKSEIDDSNVIIDKNIKLLNIRVNLMKIDCSEYISKNQVPFNSSEKNTSNSKPRSKQRNNLRAVGGNNIAVKLPKSKLLLQRYKKDTEKSNLKSSVKKRRAGKDDTDRKSRRLLGEPPLINDAESSVDNSGVSNSSRSQRKKTAKKLNRDKRANSNKNVSSIKNMKNTNNQHYTLDNTNIIAMSNGEKNRANIFNGNRKLIGSNVASKMEQTITDRPFSVDKFKHVLNVWYECLCCDQKYLKLDHIKEHVRGHFPNCLTS